MPRINLARLMFIIAWGTAFLGCLTCPLSAAEVEFKDASTPESIATQIITPDDTKDPYAITGEALVQLITQMVNFDINGATIVYNRPTGQLIIKNTPNNIAQAEDIIASLRKNHSEQVEIEARIITVSSDDIDALGLQFADVYSPLTMSSKGDGVVTLGSNSANEIEFPNITERKSTNNLGQELVLGIQDKHFDLELAIDALKSKATVNTLSAPQLTVYNNQRGHVQISNIQKYVSEVDAEVEATDQAVYYTIDTTTRQAPSGTILDVTPTINNDGTITLELHPVFIRVDMGTPVTIQSISNQNLDSNTTSSLANNSLTLPTFTQQSVDTTVVIPDGGTAVIGGLIDEVETKYLHKVPVLSALPLVGKLFTNKKSRNEKSHLIMFIKATSKRF